MNYIDIINSCKYTFLIELSDIELNTLKIVIREAVVSESETELQIGEKVIKDLRSIEINDSCRKFEIIFKKYVGYSVRNESFALWDENEKFDGYHYRIYKNSHYLDFISKTTDGSFTYEGEHLVHYGIYCGDHIVDIVSIHQPDIRMY